MHSLEVRVPLGDPTLLRRVLARSLAGGRRLLAASVLQSAPDLAAELVERPGPGFTMLPERWLDRVAGAPDCPTARSAALGPADGPRAPAGRCAARGRPGPDRRGSGAARPPGVRAAAAPLRVLALVTDGFGGHGGIARYNQAFLGALAGLDAVARIEVLARYGTTSAPLAAGPGAPAGAAPLHQATAPGKASYVARTAVAAARRRFDLVFCGHIHMAPLAAVVAAWQGCPWWLQVHGIDAWDAPGRAIRAAVARADLVTAVSRYTRQRVLAWADLEPDRVRVLPNMVEPRFRPGPKPEALVRRHGLEGRRVLLTVSRLPGADRAKGHEHVIEAVAALAGRHPDLVYLIAGDGPDRPRLEALAAAHGVTERVRFLGRVPDEELPALYRLADLFVMPSRGEGFGIVFLEAMASGVPALGGDADGSVDALQDGVLGTIAPPERTTPVLAALLDRPPPAGPELAEKVHRIFGPDAFAVRLAEIVAALPPPKAR